MRLRDKAWEEVSSRTCNQLGRNYGLSVLKEFEGFEDEPVSVAEGILSLGKSMGLEVGDDDEKE